MSDLIELVEFKPVLIGEDIPIIHDNIVLDHDSIGVLPEPKDYMRLREQDLGAMSKRMVQELPNGNWVYLEFEDAVQMLNMQREHSLFVTCVVLNEFLGKPINEGSIKNIQGNIECALGELSETETEPGMFDERLVAAAANYRLQRASKNKDE